ncbi:MAG: multiubiquitin domain-containing protein [Pyrinomonadaceae bacterium]
MEKEVDSENKELEIVDLEEHARTYGTKAPLARKYAFRVDKERVEVDQPQIKGAEILHLVGKKPHDYKLYQHKRGHQPILIGPDQTVDLREEGVERFTTMPKDTTEGRDGDPCLRQDFRLPQTDEEYLNRLGLPWEARVDGTSHWVLINDWILPAGYNREKVTLALMIPSNYSDSQIDMVFFQDAIARSDGLPIGAISNLTIFGTIWQQWSRHRTAGNPWRIGIDDISSHLCLVDEWLRREFNK